MALIENLNLWPPSNLQRNLALNPPPKLFNFKPSATHSIRKTLHTCRCSLVNEQQQQQASFTDQEKQLIDALIGIQGRGKSASSQQLNVQKTFDHPFCSLIFASLWILRVLHLTLVLISEGCGACSSSSGRPRSRGRSRQFSSSKLFAYLNIDQKCLGFKWGIKMDACLCSICWDSV